jgi:chemotaxis protein histidine kinase CheA
MKAEEHTAALLEEGLLRLESNPIAGQTLAAVFPGTHSLKGGSRMLGMRMIERLAHGLGMC